MSLSAQFQNLRINRERRSSSLSVDDLSDPGAMPARKVSESNTNNEQARFLVKAFKDFILPIVYAQGSGLGTTNRKTNAHGESIGREIITRTYPYFLAENTDHGRLGPAAQQLVDALENFITSLLSPEVIHKDGVQRDEVVNIWENAGLVPFVKPPIYEAQPGSLILRRKASEQPRLLKLALEVTRYRVFNMMPIRLLSFKPDGSGIRLLGRSDTWDHVSTLIEAGFDEDQINQDILRRNYPTYNPNSEREVIEHFISRYTGYAILSHTWLHDKPGEVTYGDWNSGNFDIDSLGYQKLFTFCKVAAGDYGITLGWMDTVCINKDSSAELDESIRSMFKWYCDASICIAYLAQTTTLVHMHNDTWFTRGWTLQELLAPRYIKFYGADWTKLNSDLKNDKDSPRVQTEISAATTITPDELISDNRIAISRKMQWAANRHVTREEDTAYSLMGIFHVSLSIAYGEGAGRAFFRLVQQILNSKGEVLDIINWGYGLDLMDNIGDTRVSLLIPSHPQQYIWRAANISRWPVPAIPVNLTHLGLHLSILLMPGISSGDPNLQPFRPIGGYCGSVTFDLPVVDLYAQDGISPGRRYNILDVASQDPTDGTNAYRHQITFGVLNFAANFFGNESRVSFSRTLDKSRTPCFAVALSYDRSAFSSLSNAAAGKAVKVLRTRTAITFDLLSYSHEGGLLSSWVHIPEKELARHGMQLLDIYL